jgi:hypothetical protein
MTWDTSHTRPRAPYATASRRERAATPPAQARGQARRAGRACSSVSSPLTTAEKIERVGEIRERIEYHKVETHTYRPDGHDVTQ